MKSQPTSELHSQGVPLPMSKPCACQLHSPSGSGPNPIDIPMEQSHALGASIGPYDSNSPGIFASQGPQIQLKSSGTGPVGGGEMGLYGSP